MQKTLVAITLLTISAALPAQTTTTNCYAIGSSVQCTSHNDAQQQEQMNQAFRNLGQALAERRERKRAEKAAKQALAQQEAVKAAVQRAIASDTAAAAPPPTDEDPIVLVCAINTSTATIALYEKHHRADITAISSRLTR